MQLSQDRRGSDRRLTERRVLQVTATVCPLCGSQHVNRSATRWWERPLRWITPLVPFRCRTCGWRGWRRAEWLRVGPSGSSSGLDDQDVFDRSEPFTDDVAPKAS